MGDVVGPAVERLPIAHIRLSTVSGKRTNAGRTFGYCPSRIQFRVYPRKAHAQSPRDRSGGNSANRKSVSAV